MKIDGRCALCDEPATIVMKYTVREPSDTALIARWLDHLLAPKHRACNEHAGMLVDRLRQEIRP